MFREEERKCDSCGHVFKYGDTIHDYYRRVSSQMYYNPTWAVIHTPPFVQDENVTICDNCYNNKVGFIKI